MGTVRLFPYCIDIGKNVAQLSGRIEKEVAQVNNIRAESVAIFGRLDAHVDGVVIDETIILNLSND